MPVKPIVAALVLALGVFALAAAPKTKQCPGPELKKFEGIWELAAGEKDGVKIGEDDAKRNRLTFRGNRMEVVTPHQSQETILATIVRLDTGKDPREVHWVRNNGPQAGVTLNGIFKFTDPDTLWICFDPAGRVAPAAFSAPAGSGHILHVWKRAGK